MRRGRNDVVALGQDRCYRTKCRGHAGGRANRSGSTLKRGNALLEYRNRRVCYAGIGMPATFQVEYRRRGVRVGKHIRRGLVNWRRACAEVLINRLSGVQREGIEMMKMRHGLNQFERPVECVDQVFNIFEADRDTYQPIDNPDTLTLGLFDVGMRHRDRMRNQ
jgi:hypothetical protein